MIEHQVDQGSAAWLALRLGRPTASEFHRIVTPAGKFSSQSRAYAMRLVAEQLLNRTLDSLDHLEWVERGKLLEPQAVRLYEFEQDVKTRAVGLCLSDDGRIGASPDRLVGEAGLLEVKCLAPQNHLALLVDGPGADFTPQIMGQLLVTGREWVDLYGYSEEMPAARVRTHRDDAYIAKLRDALAAFCDMRDLLLDRARAAGVFQAAAEIRTPAEAELGGPPEGLSPGANDPFGWAEA